jgi:NAD(P)-dependent dehydrogenase (short-subunit alcohol dehydrogenase family)
MSDTKTILITGVTRGLGHAMVLGFGFWVLGFGFWVLGFASLGHTVIRCGRSAENVHRLRKELGARHRCNVIDVRSDLRVGNWARQILDAYGPPDLLINNAALINSHP